MHYPREIIAERVVFTPAAQAQIAACRGPHNRLGMPIKWASSTSQAAFPPSIHLEFLDDLLVLVAHELAMDPRAIQDYAQRQATVSAHQDQIRLHQEFRPIDRGAHRPQSDSPGGGCASGAHAYVDRPARGVSPL